MLSIRSSPYTTTFYFAMLTIRRHYNDSRTLREILDYNDRIIRQQNSLKNDTAHRSDLNSTRNKPKTYTLNYTTILSVLNWNEIFTNDAVISFMCSFIVMTLSQLMFSYVSFCAVIPQRGMEWFHISQFVNLMFCYMMPFSLIRDFDEIADAPLNRLAAEVSIYKQLKFNSYFFFICTTVSAIGLYQIFTGGPFTETDIDLQTNEEITSDLTSVVRALQTISFQLTLINFLLCVINLFMADRKIRVCFNRVERMQDREDMEVMFNNNLLDNKFKSDFF